MLTNYCRYDCAYCINRRSNDIPRATLSVTELVNLTIEFYRRNYIEGLFLSSGVVRNPDYTMERLVRIVKDLRTIHRFNGYIHLKGIPGASPELIHEAGLYADRMSVNIEIPNEKLQTLAPEKDFQSVFTPMRHIQQGVLESAEERKNTGRLPVLPLRIKVPDDYGSYSSSDKDILRLSSALYQRPTMKGYTIRDLYPSMLTTTVYPNWNNRRWYGKTDCIKADWLLRFYQFKVDEIVDDSYPDLDLEIDPKLAWALRHPEKFPVDINRADYELLLRIPGLGVKSAKMIIVSRRYGKINGSQLKNGGRFEESAIFHYL